MPDVAVFKIEILTEGGYVTYAPKYSQYSENLDLAGKRLAIQVESWVKNLQKEIREDAKVELGKTPPRILTA